MKTFIEQLSKEKSQEFLTNILERYLSPAFGSIPKRELDILVFTQLMESDFFGTNPELYDIVSKLRVTRSKARNLLYEYELRKNSQTKLDDDLQMLLSEPTLVKSGDCILLEVSSPLLIDHIKAKLKKTHYLTNGSFSEDIIKMTSAAFASLLEDTFEFKTNLDRRHKLEELGLEPTTKDVMFSIVKTIIANTMADGTTQTVQDAFKWIKDHLKRKDK